MNKPNLIDGVIRFCLERKVIVFLLLLLAVSWGVMVAPFDWETGWLPRNPIPVDAIPDIGENQQIVFTKWTGRSPQDVEDQITYPLTVSLLGVPGVKTIRSYSFFGFSTIYVVFKDDIEFYWSRTRVLEKLSSLSPGTLPKEVQPILGPDSTALGQVYWYTIEGRDPQGNPTGGWDLNELRTAQDWYVRYALLAADGVSEVASIGGYVDEYQIDVDPDAMRAFGVKLDEVYKAVRMSNIDVGARTIEVNKVEYVIRGLGFIKKLKDIEEAVIAVHDNIPVRIKDVAVVDRGPALRRGALDKEGAEAVGGVVVVRYGDNPLRVIQNVKEKIKEIAPGLPKKTLEDGTVSQMTVVPFYDRAGLIHETLGTLNIALTDEILVTIIVVLVILMHLRSAMLISGLLPMAVLMCFIAMKVFGIDANIVALSGIAIAIGTMVDMGIVICENILRHLEEADPSEDRLEVIYSACQEVGHAVITAIATTVTSFLPVFTMEAAEGKLFQPLAFTKTFAMVASIIVALTIIPPLAHILFTKESKKSVAKPLFHFSLIGAGLIVAFSFAWWAGSIIALIGGYRLVENKIPELVKGLASRGAVVLAIIIVAYILSEHWVPLGPEKGVILNFIFVAMLIGGLLGLFHLFQLYFSRILEWCLSHKAAFLSIPLIILLFGGMVWGGFDALFSWVPDKIKETAPLIYLSEKFPGLGKEFMPPLDEGSFLYMPTTMPHASIGEVLDVIQKQDQAITAIPEVDSAVGKLGRAETPLDPAPISMIETIINYKSEYITDTKGRRVVFRFDEDKDEFVRDEKGELIPDPNGRPFRQWRPNIKKADDIWKEIVKAGKIPGATSAPRLQPIAARIVMLQSGMRAPMGVKIKGPDLETIERVGLEFERLLKQVPSVEPSAVIADRIVGKPYLEIEIDRTAIARYGVMMREIQDVIEIAIGGRKITTTVEGRERYPVRVRYMRELRDSIESLDRILVPASDGSQIPLTQLAKINYIRGPQVIKSEDTFLTGYVLFDMKPGMAEVDVVEDCQRFLKEKIKSGELNIPSGVSYIFAGSYENQVRSEKKLMVVLPLALFVIFMVIYLQFNSASTTGLIFSGILVSWAGGFIMIWLYGQPWFLNFSLFGTDMRNLFQVHPFNLSVAVWVGFLALFGIAAENGIVMGTYLDQSFQKSKPKSIAEIHRAVRDAANRRARPCLMTTGTTILALIPVLTSTGRGADIMVPMAIPSFGGMVINVMTILVVPVLYCAVKEFQRTGSSGEKL